MGIVGPNVILFAAMLFTTPGLMKDIQCHERPYLDHQIRNQANKKDSLVIPNNH